MIVTRHFLQLYLLIVATLVAVSWGQEQLLRTAARDNPTHAAADHPGELAALEIVIDQLRAVPADERLDIVAAIARRTQVDLDLINIHDIAGAQTLLRLKRGEPALMQASDGRHWLLRPLGDAEQVLAFKYSSTPPARSALEWSLVFVFYAAIAFVIMLWLWPLTRDLRELERATTSFGNRNWKFATRITSRSQVYPLAEAFRRMALRIDTLIGSHKDMSNAMSHEIKTPLARMRFDIEMARAASAKDELNRHLDNISADVTELNSFVTATLDYAILERAEVALNVGPSDFTLMLPAICDSVRRTLRPGVSVRYAVDSAATRVLCDAHLIETALRNLLYNAARYASAQVLLEFHSSDGHYDLTVDDDGPGIPVEDRQRIFESFVQLDEPGVEKSGFGLGLAIVRRIVEWHGGSAVAEASHLGGARLRSSWPIQSLR